jgi:hypothetical protein
MLKEGNERAAESPAVPTERQRKVFDFPGFAGNPDIPASVLLSAKIRGSVSSQRAYNLAKRSVL